MRDWQQIKRLTPKPFGYQLVQNETLTDSGLSPCNRLCKGRCTLCWILEHSHTPSHLPGKKARSGHHATYQVEAAGDVRPVPWNTDAPGVGSPRCFNTADSVLLMTGDEFKSSLKLAFNPSRSHHRLQVGFSGIYRCMWV